MNPPGGVSPPGQTALDFKMEMPKAPGQLQASKTWPEDVPEPVDPTKPTVNSPPRQKSTFEKMKDWSRAAGQTTEAMMEDMFEPSFDNLDEAKSSYNKGDLAGASAAAGMAAIGMVDPTRKGKAVKKAIVKKNAGKTGGGKKAQHANQAKRDAAKAKNTQVKAEYETLKSTPNKTPDIKKKMASAKKAMDKAKKDMDFTGENHSQRTKR